MNVVLDYQVPVKFMEVVRRDNALATLGLVVMIRIWNVNQNRSRQVSRLLIRYSARTFSACNRRLRLVPLVRAILPRRIARTVRFVIRMIRGARRKSRLSVVRALSPRRKVRRLSAMIFLRLIRRRWQRGSLWSLSEFLPVSDSVRVPFRLNSAASIGVVRRFRLTNRLLQLGNVLSLVK